MKGSINQGSVRDGSASIVKALSGAPRCPAVGNRSIILDCDLLYGTNGHVFMHPPQGTGRAPSPFGLPFGHWKLVVTSNVTIPVPATMKFGMSQRTDAGGRFLVTKTGWDKVILNETDPPAQAGARIAQVFGTNSGWRISTIGFFEFKGPDLFYVHQLDMNVIGQTSTTTLLPEQNEFCGYQFYPYIYTDLFSESGKASPPSWSSSCNDFLQFEGFDLGGIPQRLFTDGTKLGTLRFQFERISNVPLFTWSITPPRTVNFGNRSFFNPGVTPAWDWDFGDVSAHSTAQNPGSHTYASSGSYTVTLRTTDPVEIKTFNQIILIPLKANFTVIVNGSLSNFVSITITQLSIGAVTYDWDFGDGTPHSALEKPSHVYEKGHTFTITLKIGDGAGKFDTTSQTINT